MLCRTFVRIIPAGRILYHTDDSIQIKYYDNKENFLSKAAFSLTGDMGCEHGGGVSCTGNSPKGPKQSFHGYMIYNLLRFDNDKYALTLGGGKINNPGRYLVLILLINGANGSEWHAVLHRESRRSIQSVGRFRNHRLDAQPIHHVPLGIQSPRRKRSILLWLRRRNSPQASTTARPVLSFACKASPQVTVLRPTLGLDLRKIENRLNLSILVKF